MINWKLETPLTLKPAPRNYFVVVPDSINMQNVRGNWSLRSSANATNNLQAAASQPTAVAAPTSFAA